MNIDQLLQNLEYADHSMENLELTQEEILELTQEKIDNYQYIMEKMDSRVAELKAAAEGFVARAKQIDNQKQRLKDFIVFAMQKNNVSKFPGKKYSVTLVNKKLWRPIRPATMDDYVNHKDYVTTKIDWALKPTKEMKEALYKAGFHNAIKSDFEWNSHKIKNEMKQEKPTEFAQAITKFETSSYVKFSVRKGIKDEQ